MMKKFAKALEKSILHWKEMREQEAPKIEPDGDSCALCQVEQACGRCPVYLSTRKMFCNDTPYKNAYFAFVRWRNATAEAARKARIKWRREAKKEIAFLESLREEG